MHTPDDGDETSVEGARPPPWYLSAVEITHYIVASLVSAAVVVPVSMIAAGASGAGGSAPPGTTAARVLLLILATVACAAAAVGTFYSANYISHRTRRRFSLWWAVVSCATVLGLPLGLATLAALTRRRVVAEYEAREAPPRAPAGPVPVLPLEPAEVTPRAVARGPARAEAPWYLGLVQGGQYAFACVFFVVGGLVLVQPVFYLLQELAAPAGFTLPRGQWLAQFSAGLLLVGIGAAAFRCGDSIGRRSRRGFCLAVGAGECLTGVGLPLGALTLVALSRRGVVAAYEAAADRSPGFYVIAADPTPHAPPPAAPDDGATPAAAAPPL